KRWSARAARSSPSCIRARTSAPMRASRSEEHTSELQSPCNLVCRLLLEKKKRLNSSHLVISYAVFCLKKKIHHVIFHTKMMDSSLSRYKYFINLFSLYSFN